MLKQLIWWCLLIIRVVFSPVYVIGFLWCCIKTAFEAGSADFDEMCIAAYLENKAEVERNHGNKVRHLYKD